MKKVTVFKYELQLTPEQTVEVPAGSRILSAINQYERIVLYIQITDNRRMVNRRVSIRDTGLLDEPPAPDFLNTVSRFDGTAIQHVFVDHQEP